MLMGEELALERGIKKGYPLMNHYLTTISLSSMRMVADRHRQALLTTFLVVPTSMTLNDPQNRGFSEFFEIIDYDTQFKSELRRNHSR